jgi:hypothetical protein
VVESNGVYAVIGSHIYDDESTGANFVNQAYIVNVELAYPHGGTVITTSARILEALLPDGTRGSPAQRFVQEVYHDLLHRQVDQGGLDNWSHQLEGLIVQGMPLAQAEGTIVYWIQTDWQHEYFTGLVRGWYQQYLWRDVTASDLPSVASDVNYLAATVAAYPGQLVQPEMQACLGMVLSPEFTQKYATNSAFVQGLYLHALGRTAEGDPGAANLVQQLDGGAMTRLQVAQTVLLSGEHETDLVAGWFEQFLDRPVNAVDAAHVQTLAQGLQLGVPETWIVASIIGDPSQEFFNKVLP